MRNKVILQIIWFAVFFAGLLKAHSQALREINTGGKEITNAISFPTPNTGYLAGNNGTVVKTTDGGETWQSVSGGRQHNYVAVQFFTQQEGYLLTDRGELLQTVDGGREWKIVKDTAAAGNGPATAPKASTGGQPRKDTPRPAGPHSLKNVVMQATAMHFFNRKEGVMVGNLLGLSDRKRWGALLRTANGGLTWDTLYRKEAAVFSSVAFPTRNTGFILSSGGQLLRTGNGGANWQATQAVKGHGLRGFCFVSASTGYLVGGSGKGLILKTTDGGKTWQQQQSGSPYFLQTVFFKTEKTGYAAGGQGSLLKTTDGGTTWTRLVTPDKQVLKIVFVTDAGKVITAGSRNKILKER